MTILEKSSVIENECGVRSGKTISSPPTDSASSNSNPLNHKKFLVDAITEEILETHPSIAAGYSYFGATTAENTEWILDFNAVAKDIDFMEYHEFLVTCYLLLLEMYDSAEETEETEEGTNYHEPQ